MTTQSAAPRLTSLLELGSYARKGDHDRCRETLQRIGNFSSREMELVIAQGVADAMSAARTKEALEAVFSGVIRMALAKKLELSSLRLGSLRAAIDAM